MVGLLGGQENEILTDDEERQNCLITNFPQSSFVIEMMLRMRKWKI